MWQAVIAVLLLGAAPVSAQELTEDVDLDVPSRLTAPPLSKATAFPLEKDVLARARPAGGKLVVDVEGSAQPLTIDPMLQAELEAILEKYETPWAAVVAVEPATGRVLAMAEHSAEKDTRCLTLSRALAMSANVLFAKFTSRYLDPEKLKVAARAFHFNVSFPFPVPTDPSLAAIPSETYPLALTGAGFGDVYLSPLHGAALAAVAANGGLWRTPVLFERDVPQGPPTERVVTEQVAAQLTGMLEETVTEGTARRIFHERGMRVPGAVGKTGSLADKTPYRDYTWFVGFAPRDSPRIAVAAVIVNEAKWRIRATWLGREAMRLFLSRR
jgi:cell division protein FtsI/penicillin-binding protein 2